MKISNRVKTIAAGSTAVVAAGVKAGVASAATFCPDGTKLNSGQSLADCNDLKGDANTNDLMTTVNTIINIVIGVIGFIAVAMTIYGGVQYTTSAGDPGKVKKAKDSILYGIIGLVIAILAFSIVNFVLSSLTKTDPVTKPNTTVEPEKGDEGKDGEEDKKEDGTKTTVIEGSDDKSTLRTKENIAPNAKETNK